MKKSKKLSIILVCLVALLLCIGLVVLAILQGTKKDTLKPSEKAASHLPGGEKKGSEKVEVVLPEITTEAATTSPSNAIGNSDYAYQGHSGDPLEIFSYGDGEVLMKGFYQDHDNYKDCFKFTRAESGAQAPDEAQDIVICDQEELGLLKSEEYYTLDELGLADSYQKVSYDYAKSLGSNADGKVYAASFLVCPSTVIYRTDIAEEVFGGNYQEQVQEYMKTEEGMKQMGAMLKDKGYFLFATNEDLRNGLHGVDVESSIESLESAGYIDDKVQWGDDWMQNMKDGKTFAYVGPRWMTLVIQGNDTPYTWALAELPWNGYWGGAFIAVKKTCKNLDTAKAFIYYACCDPQGAAVTLKDGDVPNNKAAVKNAIDTKTYSSDQIIIGETLSIYDSVANKIQQ